MGRPLNKKYFANTNLASTGEGVGGEGVASVTVSGTFSGFAAETTTVTFSAPQIPGGETATGTAVIDGSGNVTGITVTNSGSGYTSAPTVTVTDSDVGAETASGTLTAVLTSGASARQNGIVAYAQTTSGGSRSIGDIISQKGSTKFRVVTADGTATCTLRTDGGSGEGTMDITAYDSDGGEYWVKRITSHNAVLVIKGSNGGSQFTNDTKVPWSFGDAVAGVSVKIENA